MPLTTEMKAVAPIGSSSKLEVSAHGEEDGSSSALAKRLAVSKPQRDPRWSGVDIPRPIFEYNQLRLSRTAMWLLRMLTLFKRRTKCTFLKILFLQMDSKSCTESMSRLTVGSSSKYCSPSS